MNRVTKLLVGDGTNVGTTLPTITKGDLFLVSEAGTVLNSTTAAALTAQDTVYVVMGTGAGKTAFSAPIKGKNIRSIKAGGYTAPTEQVSYIGSNGTTGSIAVTNGVEYVMNVILKDDQRVLPHRQTRDVFHVSADAATSDVEVTNALIKLMVKSSLTKYIKFERVNSNAGTEALDTSDTLVATKGSNKIIVTETGGVLPYLFAVGDYIRLGTAVTSPIYRITATTVTVADGGTLTVDVPVQESFSASGTGAAEYITATQAAAAEFGFKMTGKAIDDNGIDVYSKVSFTATFAPVNADPSDSEVREMTTATKAYKGIGYFQDVRDMEWLSIGMFGQMNRRLFPVAGVDSMVSSSLTYNVLAIEHDQDVNTGFDRTNALPTTTLVAIPPVTGEQSDWATADKFCDILQAYFTAASAAGAVTGDVWSNGSQF
jgi:hypothetical protein